jgi:lysophospholipase L1-like esterase
MTNKTQNKTIVIAGDSWACGEWNNSSTTGCKISHPGLSKYLTDLGYLVINLARPGGSNFYSADRVDNFLTVSTHLNISHVFVFQTEWIRDMRDYTDKKLLNLDLTYGYQTLKMRLISRFYERLSKVAQQANVPIHIIGGCSDTIWLDKFSQEYPGLNNICHSFTNLLLIDNHRIANPVYAIITDAEQVKFFKETMDSNDLELFLDDIDKGRQRFSTWQEEKRFFWPDGMHPNRLGHKILFDFLKTQLPDL